jgi:uncharacterized repeat protein (TIGR01451 family)
MAFQPGSGANLSRAAPADLMPPGGFLETATTGQMRPHLSAQEIQTFLPARGVFTFPAPYNTAATRITNGDDCSGGGDCVESVGYSYWRNINNHAGQNEMLIFLGLNRLSGGPGPTLFRYDKTTDQVTNLGPLFDPSSNMSWRTGEGWYWSGTRPNTIYIDNGPQMLRYDVMTRQFETVLDVRSEFGADKVIGQMHSSDDDMVHSATLAALPDYQALGCVVYHEDTKTFQYFPKIGNFNECHVDKSGRWLMSLEDVDFRYDLEMRIFDLQTGNERLVWDQAGAVGHADMGYGYVVGADNWNIFPNAFLLWDFSKDPLSGLLVSHNTEWTPPAPNHIAHGNARPDLPSDRQYACGSSASRANGVWSNEIICFRLDGSLDVLVVAPVLTDPDAPGGGNDYRKEPKGNLDVTGQYFIWTSNMGGDRLDAFIVKVPAQLLTTPPVGVVPPILSVTDSPDPVPAGGTITYTLSYFNRGGTDLSAVVIQDKLPPDTSFISATDGGTLSNGVAAWSVGALPAGGSGSVQMTVRVLPSLQAGGTIINGISAIDSNETATVTGFPASTTVVPSTAPIVSTVVEIGTNSVYVPQGGTWTIRLEGTNFGPGMVVDLGADVTSGPVSLEGTGRMTVPITVLPSAALGRRAVTVTNSAYLSGSKPDALAVVKPTDINGDCRIDGGDLNIFARSWNIAGSEPGFNATADLDGDGYVGPLDLAILAEYFGQKLVGCM